MAEQNLNPRINQELCTGCRACVMACPTGALAQVDGKAALVHADKCTYCAACETLCPVIAIELPYLIRKSTRIQQVNNCTRSI
jgi:ferredoxin